MTELDYIKKWITQTEQRIKTLSSLMRDNAGTEKFDWLASMHSKEKQRLNEYKLLKNKIDL